MIKKNSRVNQYQIIEKIGEGGMGKVYLAFDSRLQRKVALKFLSMELSKSEQFRKRFTNEALSAAKLNHPNIVTVHEVGEFENQPFITMTYVTGNTLEELKRIRGLSITEVIDIGIQIAEGLVAAHSNGVTHRDLKPANIVIDESARVQILDFGLAISNESRDVEDTLTKLTKAGSVAGTVPYMSPEQLRGRNVDHRSDIFALGVILYELICGTRPFSGSDAAEIISSILRDQPKSITEIRNDTPYDLIRIVGRCLQKDPERRFQTAKDIRNELEDLQSLNEIDSSGGRFGSSGGETSENVSEDKFVLTANLVRQLENGSPKMIGGELTFVYNNAESDTLAIYLSPWGLEQLGMREIIEALPCKAVAPNLFGWDKEAKFRPVLSLDDHAIILRAFFKYFVKRFGIKRVIIIGFSASADHVLQMINSDEGIGVPLDGAIINGCNLDLSTCFVSSVFSKIESNPESKILETLNDLSNTPSTIHDWILTQNYLVAIMQKFGTNVEPIKRYAMGIVEPFMTNEKERFANLYRSTVSKIPNVRFVFSTDDTTALDRILQRHLEENILGDNYSEKTIKRMDLSHIQTGQPEIVIELVKELLQEVAQNWE